MNWNGRFYLRKIIKKQLKSLKAERKFCLRIIKRALLSFLFKSQLHFEFPFEFCSLINDTLSHSGD